MEHGEELLVRVDERSRRNEGRIKALEENQQALEKLVVSVELIAQSQKRIEDDVGELKGKVDGIEAQDGKKWRTVAAKALELLVAAVLGFALARIGF